MTEKTDGANMLSTRENQIVADFAQGQSYLPIALPVRPGKPSIAVLALKNMSGDPRQEYFSDGIKDPQELL